MQGGLLRFEDRKEKQFMLENYGATIPRHGLFVKRQVFILLLRHVMDKWKRLKNVAKAIAI